MNCLPITGINHYEKKDLKCTREYVLVVSKSVSANNTNACKHPGQEVKIVIINLYDCVKMISTLLTSLVTFRAFLVIRT